MNVKKYESGSGVVIEIDHDTCVGSGECVRVCPVGVYELENGKSTAPNVEACIECCACVAACPTGAIKHSSC